MLQRAQISADEMSVLDSAVRRAGELEFLVEGLELLGSTPEGEGQAYPEKAVRTASVRLGAGPDAANFAEERWGGVQHQFVERVVFELLANANTTQIEAFYQNHVDQSPEGNQTP